MKVKTLQVLWHGKDPVLSVDFNPADGLLASCGTDKEIKLWRVETDADGNPTCGTSRPSPRTTRR